MHRMAASPSSPFSASDLEDREAVAEEVVEVQFFPRLDRDPLGGYRGHGSLASLDFVRDITSQAVLRSADRVFIVRHIVQSGGRRRKSRCSSPLLSQGSA
jgi:hypothetical protein